VAIKTLTESPVVLTDVMFVEEIEKVPLTPLKLSKLALPNER
jgi:hypothetical protein